MRCSESNSDSMVQPGPWGLHKGYSRRINRQVAQRVVWIPRGSVVVLTIEAVDEIRVLRPQTPLGWELRIPVFTPLGKANEKAQSSQEAS
jgi:hypothetical protein